MTAKQSARPARAATLSLFLPVLAGLLLLTGCGGGDESGETPTAGEGSASAGAGSDSAPRARTVLDVDVTVRPAEGTVAADAPAVLRGVARIDGSVPPRRQVVMDHIPGCRQFSGDVLNETVIATEDGRLQNVFVYVSRGIDRASAEPVPEEPAVIEQEGCVFKPHITTVRAGQTILIKNLDKTNHNVHAKPQHGSNKAFNKTQPAGGKDLEVVFPRAEIGIPIGCDIHPWMRAFVAVVDHPYHALSGEQGDWSIEVPPGEYLVEAWHERFGNRKVSVTLGPGETAEIGFVYETKKKNKKNP